MVSEKNPGSSDEVGRLLMADIARVVGCSVATVSRALRPETAHLVRERRRLEILKAVRQSNFLPNRGASTLRRQEISSLTVVIPNESYIFKSDFYGAFLSGVFSAATEAGLETNITPAPMSSLSETIVDFSARAESFIYLPRYIPLRRLQKLVEFQIPVVVYRGSLPLGVSADEVGISTVGIDNAEGMKKSVLHLFDLGHRRLAFVNGPKNQRDAEEREVGFREAFRERGFPFEERFVHRGDFDEKTGEDAWKAWLAFRPRPTAFVCGDDEIAHGLIRAARKDGVQCPRDISVTGFDDQRLASLVTPGLTTISQPVTQLGAAAVELLLRRRGAVAQDSDHPEHITLNTELVIRESTKALK